MSDDGTQHLTDEAAQEVADNLPSMECLTYEDYMERATEPEESTVKMAAAYLEDLQGLGIAMLSISGKRILVSIPALQQYEQQLAFEAMAEQAEQAEQAEEVEASEEGEDE